MCPPLPRWLLPQRYTLNETLIVYSPMFNNNNNNNNNNLFSIRYSNTLFYTIHNMFLYNIGIKKIGNSRLRVFFYNKIL
jgi:hypothetical protein